MTWQLSVLQDVQLEEDIQLLCAKDVVHSAYLSQDLNLGRLILQLNHYPVLFLKWLGLGHHFRTTFSNQWVYLTTAHKHFFNIPDYSYNIVCFTCMAKPLQFFFFPYWSYLLFQNNSPAFLLCLGVILATLL